MNSEELRSLQAPLKEKYRDVMRQLKTDSVTNKQ